MPHAATEQQCMTRNVMRLCSIEQPAQLMGAVNYKSTY